MNGPAITVRAATVADAPAIARIQVLGWDHAFGHIMSKEFRSARGVVVREGEWRERLEAPKPGTHYLVAEDADEVVGITGGGPLLNDETITEGVAKRL